MKLVFRSNTLD